MRQEKLDQIIEMIPIMKNMVDQEVAISIWDTDGTVLYFSKAESFSLHFDVGYRLEDKRDKIFEVMSTGKTIHNKLQKETLGVAIEGNLVPVFDGGKVVGCIACVYSTEHREELEKKTNIINEVHKSVENLEKNISGIYDVVESIKGNTSSIKMLSLNAYIEAARSGEDGRGFTIVAHEMGKLSQMSADSVSGVNKTLDEISRSIKEVTESINKI